MFSTAGHLANRHSGTAISFVAAFTYSGSIVSSPMIGGLSDGFNSLRFAFIVVAVILFLISPLGYGIPPEDFHSGSRKRSLNFLGDDKKNEVYAPLLSDDGVIR